MQDLIISTVAIFQSFYPLIQLNVILFRTWSSSNANPQSQTTERSIELKLHSFGTNHVWSKSRLQGLRNFGAFCNQKLGLEADLTAPSLFQWFLPSALPLFTHSYFFFFSVSSSYYNFNNFVVKYLKDYSLQKIKLILIQKVI